MGDTHSAIGGVNALTAVATRAININPQVVRVDFDVGFFGFRQNRHGDGASMNPTLTLGRGHTLDAMNPRFELQSTIRCVTNNFKNNFFIATGIVGTFAEKLGFEAVIFAESQIHAHQFSSEQTSLVATSAGADFDDGVFIIVRIFRQQHQHKFLLGRC